MENAEKCDPTTYHLKARTTIYADEDCSIKPTMQVSDVL